MKNLVFALFILFAGVSSAEVQLVPTEEILLKSDLVIQAKVRSVNDVHFRVEIVDVFADQGRFGLRTGQYLKVNNIHWRGCMSPFNISRYDTIALALTKIKDGWRITNSEYIPSFINGRAELVQDCPQSNYTADEWKVEVKELVRYFNYENYHVCANTDLLSFNKQTSSKWIKYLYIYYYEGYWKKWNSDFNCGEEVVHVEIEPTLIKPDTMVSEFCPLQPEHLEGLNDTLRNIGHRVYLSEQQVLNENEMDGKLYVSVVVELDSTLSNVSVIRSFYPPLNEFAEKEVEQKVKLIPGGLDHSRKKRCKYILPIRILREL